MSAWISARDGQVHTSPLLNAYSTRPSTALSRNSSSRAITSPKKMFGDLPPSSTVEGIRFWAAYCMISRPVTVSPVKLILAIRGLVARALPIWPPGPLTTLITPGGRTSSIVSISFRIDQGVGEAGFITEQFTEVVGDQVLVDLGRPALLRTRGRGEIPEMIDDQRDVSGQGLADRLAVLPALGDREHLLVLLDRIRDSVQDLRPPGRRHFAPRILGRVSGVQRQLDIR